MKGIFFVFRWSVNAEVVRVFVCEAHMVKCPTCGGAGVKRNGTTSKGLQRYRCTKCGVFFVIRDQIFPERHSLTSSVNG